MPIKKNTAYNKKPLSTTRSQWLGKQVVDGRGVQQPEIYGFLWDVDCQFWSILRNVYLLCEPAVYILVDLQCVHVSVSRYGPEVRAVEFLKHSQAEINWVFINS